jgi:hypothetical protein
MRVQPIASGSHPGHRAAQHAVDSVDGRRSPLGSCKMAIGLSARDVWWGPRNYGNASQDFPIFFVH